MIGCPFLSKTFVPTGEFSSTNPYPSSTAELCITGGLISTGFTSMYSLAVVDLWLGDSSSALNMKCCDNSSYIQLYYINNIFIIYLDSY